MAGLQPKHHRVDGDDWDQDIDLSKAISDGIITIFEVSQADTLTFKNRFDQSYFCDLDDEEAESLVTEI